MSKMENNFDWRKTQGGVPANMVTTNTEQTIKAKKIFSDISTEKEPIEPNDLINKSYLDTQIVVKKIEGVDAYGVIDSSGNPLTLYGSDPIAPDDFTTKNYVDNIFKIEFTPNQSSDNTLTTKQVFNLSKEVREYKGFKIVGYNATSPEGIFEIQLTNNSKSYGQSNGLYLSGTNINKTIRWVNVSGSGDRNEIWIYADFAILEIYGSLL